MSERLSNFLVDLASHPDQMVRFLADPSAAMSGSGLTPDERDALIARDAYQLRRLLAAKKGGGNGRGVAGPRPDREIGGKRKPKRKPKRKSKK
jgi:hypothetical protein